MHILHVLLSINCLDYCLIARPYIHLRPYAALNVCWFVRVRYPDCENHTSRHILCPGAQQSKICRLSYSTEIAGESIVETSYSTARERAERVKYSLFDRTTKLQEKEGSWA
jgi:hypothetical protein